MAWAGLRRCRSEGRHGFTAILVSNTNIGMDMDVNLTFKRAVVLTVRPRMHLEHHLLLPFRQLGANEHSILLFQVLIVLRRPLQIYSSTNPRRTPVTMTLKQLVFFLYSRDEPISRQLGLIKSVYSVLMLTGTIFATPSLACPLFWKS